MKKKPITTEEFEKLIKLLGGGKDIEITVKTTKSTIPIKNCNSKNVTVILDLSTPYKLLPLKLLSIHAQKFQVNFPYDSTQHSAFIYTGHTSVSAESVYHALQKLILIATIKLCLGIETSLNLNHKDTLKQLQAVAEVLEALQAKGKKLTKQELEKINEVLPQYAKLTKQELESELLGKTIGELTDKINKKQEEQKKKDALSTIDAAKPKPEAQIQDLKAALEALQDSSGNITLGEDVLNALKLVLDGTLTANLDALKNQKIKANELATLKGKIATAVDEKKKALSELNNAKPKPEAQIQDLKAALEALQDSSGNITLGEDVLNALKAVLDDTLTTDDLDALTDQKIQAKELETLLDKITAAINTKKQEEQKKEKDALVKELQNLNQELTDKQIKDLNQELQKLQNLNQELKDLIQNKNQELTDKQIKELQNQLEQEKQNLIQKIEANQKQIEALTKANQEQIKENKQTQTQDQALNAELKTIYYLDPTTKKLSSDDITLLESIPQNYINNFDKKDSSLKIVRAVYKKGGATYDFVFGDTGTLSQKVKLKEAVQMIDNMDDQVAHMKQFKRVNGLPVEIGGYPTTKTIIDDLGKKIIEIGFTHNVTNKKNSCSSVFVDLPISGLAKQSCGLEVSLNPEAPYNLRYRIVKYDDKLERYNALSTNIDFYANNLKDLLKNIIDYKDAHYGGVEKEMLVGNIVAELNKIKVSASAIVTDKRGVDQLILDKKKPLWFETLTLPKTRELIIRSASSLQPKGTIKARLGGLGSIFNDSHHNTQMINSIQECIADYGTTAWYEWDSRVTINPFSEKKKYQTISYLEKKINQEFIKKLRYDYKTPPFVIGTTLAAMDHSKTEYDYDSSTVTFIVKEGQEAIKLGLAAGSAVKVKFTDLTGKYAKTINLTNYNGKDFIAGRVALAQEMLQDATKYKDNIKYYSRQAWSAVSLDQCVFHPDTNGDPDRPFCIFTVTKACPAINLAIGDQIKVSVTKDFFDRFLTDTEKNKKQALNILCNAEDNQDNIFVSRSPRGKDGNKEDLEWKALETETKEFKSDFSLYQVVNKEDSTMNESKTEKVVTKLQDKIRDVYSKLLFDKSKNIANNQGQS